MEFEKKTHIGSCVLRKLIKWSQIPQIVAEHWNLPEFWDEIPFFLLLFLYSQHDGSHAHKSMPVTRFLAVIFEGHIIGYGDAVECSPWSLDLSPGISFFGVHKRPSIAIPPTSVRIYAII